MQPNNNQDSVKKQEDDDKTEKMSIPQKEIKIRIKNYSDSTKINESKTERKTILKK